jgi:hypothetical protein
MWFSGSRTNAAVRREQKTATYVKRIWDRYALYDVVHKLQAAAQAREPHETAAWFIEHGERLEMDVSELRALQDLHAPLALRSMGSDTFDSSSSNA